MKFALVALSAVAGLASAEQNVRTHRDLASEIEELKEANRKLQATVQKMAGETEKNLDTKFRGQLKPVGWNKKSDRHNRIENIGDGRDLRVYRNHAVCYNDGLPPQISSFNIGINLDIPIAIGNQFDIGYMEYGFIDVYIGESLIVEASVSTLLLNAFGGNNVEAQIFFGARIAATVTNILMAPFLTKCPDNYIDIFFHNCSEQVSCLADACRADATPVDAQPRNTLPVNGVAIFDYRNLQLQAPWVGPRLYYEVMANFNLETTTGKFFYGGGSAGALVPGLYILDFGFTSFAAGVHLQALPAAVDVLEWTITEATVGPHIIEVEKTKVWHRECDYDVSASVAANAGLQDVALVETMRQAGLISSSGGVDSRTIAIAGMLGMSAPVLAQMMADAVAQGPP